MHIRLPWYYTPDGQRLASTTAYPEVMSMQDEMQPDVEIWNGSATGTFASALSANDAVSEDLTIGPKATRGALIDIDRHRLEAIHSTVPGGALNIQDIYPLSPLQEGILFHHLMNESWDTYVLSTLFQLRSQAEVGALVSAVQRVIDRHDVLRSAVLWEDLPRPVQVVHRHASLPVAELKLDRGEDLTEQLRLLMRPWRQRMDLRTAPLMRLHVGADPHSASWYALLQVHHIACDHQSLNMIVAEVLVWLRGDKLQLPPPVPFREYVAETLDVAVDGGAEEFFRKKLGDVQEPTAPFGLLSAHQDGLEIEEARQVMDGALAQEVRFLKDRSGISAARLIHAAWALVVARTSGRDDVVYGTVLLAASQRGRRSQRMIGLSVNTLPLRLDLQGVSAAELVDKTHRELKELRTYESVPLTLAQQCAGTAGSTPLFTSLLNYRHAAAEFSEHDQDAVGVHVVARGEAWTNYPITVTVDDVGDAFIVMAKVYRRIGATRLIDHLTTAIRSLVRALRDAPRTAALALEVIPQEELLRVTKQFNTTDAPYARGKLIHELFEEQVEKSPHAVAVVGPDGSSLAYAALNSRANQLARYLRSRGVGPDQPVAILVDRSLEMVVAMLGVLKAGGAYIPLDPNNPSERLEHILADAKPRIVLLQGHLKGAVREINAEAFVLDEEWAAIERQSSANLEPQSFQTNPAQMAYLIYTSGSTGKPKGVMVEHRNIVNYSTHVMRQFEIASGNGSLVCTSVSFDLMLTGFYPVLLSGRTVRLCREQNGLPELTDAVLQSEDLAPLKLTPSHMQLLEPALRSGQLRGRVRVLVLGGEQLRASAVDLWRAHAPSTRIFNHYGPTEATVGCVTLELSDQVDDPVPLGHPISNTRIYILDSRHQVVPVGATGEIFIGGDGVSRGYLNRPRLTAERFIADKFSSKPSSRLYRTGDLGCWRPDGTILYLGRSDHQVKIRGYRIEVGEIEAQLVRHQRVSAAVVSVSEDVSGEKRLVAYVVPRSAHGIDTLVCPEDLRDYLRSALPEYMVPRTFAMLKSIPTTPNGKVDRAALPAPGLVESSSREYQEPEGEVEEILAGVWQQLLRLERVGRQDNFFELGGHSLLIMQMLDRLRRLGLSAELRRIFESSTLADLALALTREGEDELKVPLNLIPVACATITPQMLTLVELEQEHVNLVQQSVPGGAANVQDIYPLAPLQEGILFHHLLSEQGGDVYVLPTLLAVSSRSRLDELIGALQAVVDRHDVLRSAVLWEKLPRPVQVVCRRVELPVLEVTLDSDREAREQVNEWLLPERQKMDLRQAPLMRLKIAADQRGCWYVLLQLHHIIDDATSLDIVIAEVVAHLEGRAHCLTESVPYRNHVAHTLSYARMHSAEPFFRGKLGDIVEPTAPFGLLDVHGVGASIAQHSQKIELGLAQRIRAQARRLTVSAATLFHAAMALVVAKTSGKDDVVFGSVLLGRLHGGAGAQGALGMFINTLPIRINLDAPSAQELVERVQRELVELLNHEQESLSAAQRCSGVPGALPLFNTLFNYRHTARVPDDDWIRADGIRLLTRHGFTNYPITISVDDIGGEFSVTAQTDHRIEPRRMSEYLETAILALVEALEQAPTTPVTALRVQPEAERRQVVELFNATRTTFPRQQLIHKIFEEQVRRTPTVIAVIHGQSSRTYEELNSEANRLARYLKARGIGAGNLVGICMDRSPEMLVALLGILKAGAAYLPLDPNYPVERLEFAVRDAEPSVILTQGELLSNVSVSATAVVRLNEEDGITDGAADNLSRAEEGWKTPSLVYVIYTSGSTGRPKGTEMPHRAMANLLEWQRQELPLHAGQRVLQFAALSFDVAFQEIFSTLCGGGTLVLLDEWVRRDARALTELLSSQCIERLYVPPMMLQSLAEYCKAAGTQPNSLKDVITAGEQLRVSPEIVVLFKGLEGARLHNHYGPTETHVVTSLTLAASPDEWPALPSIGRPLANTQIYILNKHLRPAPVDVIGEIYIGGANVACGYLRRPQLTAERFISDPFDANPRQRVYRTGDLGKWRMDGTIEYLGRNDDQVKIRGYRVELGEIEARLAQHAQIREVAVTIKSDGGGEKRLFAYVTLRNQNVPKVEELREYMKAALPEHMVPSAFVVLERLPLTPSGKLDRRALPTPHSGDYTGGQYEAPAGGVERSLAGIWQELLEVARIGRQDNFFDFGAHSIMVLRALVKINQCFGATIKVTDVYKNPTIQQLAARLSGQQAKDDLVDLIAEAALDDAIVARPGPRREHARSILLTGATGFVGRFLLAQLLRDTDATVHCLVRATNRRQASLRLRMTLAKWDLWSDEFESRIVPFLGDLRLPRLGIDEAVYDEIARDVDAVYHCATSMNHLETYVMARAANVESSKEVLRLAITGRQKSVNFVSTLGIFVASSEEATRGIEERTPIDGEGHRNSRGYLASKWVAEKIFLTAAERGIPCNIFRLGLVWADAQSGRFDELQNVYRIIKSCLLSGYGIKDHRYALAPTPVDYVARAILFLAQRHVRGGGVFHISSSEQMARGVFECYNQTADRPLELLSLYDWIQELKHLHVKGHSLPAVPLMEYAFSMSEGEFLEHQRKARTSANIRFYFESTHAELESAGIVAPAFDEELLSTCLEGMVERDGDVQALANLQSDGTFGETMRETHVNRLRS